MAKAKRNIIPIIVFAFLCSAGFVFPVLAVEKIESDDIKNFLLEVNQKMQDIERSMIAARNITNAPLPCDIDTSLAQGATGANVYCLQHLLIATGDLLIREPTGFFGPLTEEALKKWQTRIRSQMPQFSNPQSQAEFERDLRRFINLIPLPPSTTTAALPDKEKYEIQHDEPAPVLYLFVTKDQKDGYNALLLPTNFIFAPNHLNGEHVSGEGYAELFINNVPIGRAYGSWHHIPQYVLSQLIFDSGAFTVRAELVTNDGRPYHKQGKVIMAEVVAQ